MTDVSSIDKSSKELNSYYYNENREYILHDYGLVLEDKLYVSGRSDDVLKIKGIRIASGQIEAAALESPEIIECAAIEAEGRLGVREIVLFATINNLKKEEDSTRSLLETINNLIHIKIGKHISIAKINVLKDMPKTHSGKIKRKYLRQL